MPFREKRIYSGKYLEIEVYPITKEERKKSRCKKKKESRKEQKNLNNKNAKKHLTRLINTNFSEKDIFMTCTYDDINLPSSEEDAKKDINNFIRRIRNYRRKNNIVELKYIAVIENPVVGKSGKVGRVHHHLVMDGAVERDVVEKLWKKGTCNTRRLRPSEKGFEDLARYISKDPKGKRRWTQSKNIRQPDIKINDYKFSRIKVYELARNIDDGRKIEQMYPGYIFTESFAQVYDLTGTQFYIKMRKLE